MRIKNVRIRNFRSIIDTGEITLDDKITLLLGKNEQGKTNSLKALESFRLSYKYKNDDLTYLRSHEAENQKIPIITLWFKLDEQDRKLLSTINKKLITQNELVITRYFDGHYEIEKPDLSKLQSLIERIHQSVINILKKNERDIEGSFSFLNKIDKTEHINWLKSLQGLDGGFSQIQGQASHITYTDFAVKALIELGGLDQIDKNELIKFVLSCQHSNGGFGHLSNQQPQAQLTYYGIMLLNELNALNRIDKQKQKHINWLKSLQRLDGGFWKGTGTAQSNIDSTYFAVNALIELGGLDKIDKIDKNKLIKFVLSCQHPNGGFGHLPNQQPYPQYTYNAIFLLRIFGKLDEIDKQKQQKHINWLKSLQQDDGGFGSGIKQEQSQINPTYYAVKTLMELGVSNQIDKKRLVEFILSCQHQHPKGGFGQFPNQEPTVQYTYQAIVLLRELQNHIIELFDKHLKELEKTSAPTKFEELFKNVLSIQGLDEKLVNSIKMEIDGKDFTESDLLEKILDTIPNFVYFNSIKILKDSISLSEYLRNKEKYKTFTNLFKLADLNPEKLENIEDHSMREHICRRATKKITKMINKYWKQESVTINLKVDGDKILVFIEDEVGAVADLPSKRSDGFIWFLSFYINFMAGTRGKLEDVILLLDNPGQVLHPSGQKDLLKTLEKIAEANQIIFATHSPFLIDKNKLERIRIVERKEEMGTKIYEKFWDSIYDSLQVIRASIGADISDSLFGNKNNIIVEGYSDKIYLETMTKYLMKKKKETINLNRVAIIGAGGADKIPYLLAWLKGEKYNSLALLDADDEGRKVIQEIEKRNIEVEVETDVLKLDETSEEFRGKSLEIEDLFNEEFYMMGVNRAYKEFFESRLGKAEINLEDIPLEGLRTKRYTKFFNEKNLGSFDKVKVAREINKILSRKMSQEAESTIEETIDTFEKLFKKIKEKFKNKKVVL